MTRQARKNWLNVTESFVLLGSLPHRASTIETSQVIETSTQLSCSLDRGAIEYNDPQSWRTLYVRKRKGIPESETAGSSPNKFPRSDESSISPSKESTPSSKQEAFPLLTTILRAPKFFINRTVLNPMDGRQPNPSTQPTSPGTPLPTIKERGAHPDSQRARGGATLFQIAEQEVPLDLSGFKIKASSPSNLNTEIPGDSKRWEAHISTSTAAEDALPPASVEPAGSSNWNDDLLKYYPVEESSTHLQQFIVHGTDSLDARNSVEQSSFDKPQIRTFANSSPQVKLSSIPPKQRETTASQ